MRFYQNRIKIIYCCATGLQKGSRIKCIFVCMLKFIWHHWFQVLFLRTSDSRWFFLVLQSNKQEVRTCLWMCKCAWVRDCVVTTYFHSAGTGIFSICVFPLPWVLLLFRVTLDSKLKHTLEWETIYLSVVVVTLMEIPRPTVQQQQLLAERCKNCINALKFMQFT